jgi:hypothetical protein
MNLWRLRERLKADTRALLNGSAPEIFDKICRLPPEKIAVVEELVAFRCTL